MRIVATPRTARELSPKQLREAKALGQSLIDAPERQRLTEVLLRADPGLVTTSTTPTRVVLAARGRSGVSVTLGQVWHEAELPDWHDGTAGTWLAERFLTILRTLARFTGGGLYTLETDAPVDVEDPMKFVGRYRAQSEPRSGAPLMPRLELRADAAATFSERSEQVLRRRGASVADRAWFLAMAARQRVALDLPDLPVDVRWSPRKRTLCAFDVSKSKAKALVPTVNEPPPPVPEGLEDKDRDPEAIEYLAGLFSYL